MTLAGLWGGAYSISTLSEKHKIPQYWELTEHQALWVYSCTGQVAVGGLSVGYKYEKTEEKKVDF